MSAITVLPTHLPQRRAEHILHLLLRSRLPWKLKLLFTPERWMRLNPAKSKPHITHRIQLVFFARAFNYSHSTLEKVYYVTIFFFFPILPPVRTKFVVFPPGCGDSVADF